jgi:zinc protease
MNIDAAQFAGDASKVYFIRKDVPQSTVVMGTPAPGFDPAVSADIAVLDHVIGGGDFTSRLMIEVRVKRGLAYATGSLVKNRRGAGIFAAYAQCSAAQTAETVRIMRQVCDDLRTSGPTADELAQARLALQRSYVFNFDTTSNVLGYGLGLISTACRRITGAGIMRRWAGLRPQQSRPGHRSFTAAEW